MHRKFVIRQSVKSIFNNLTNVIQRIMIIVPDGEFVCS